MTFKLQRSLEVIRNDIVQQVTYGTELESVTFCIFILQIWSNLSENQQKNSQLACISHHVKLKVIQQEFSTMFPIRNLNVKTNDD